jgi:hypothetical protein
MSEGAESQVAVKRRFGNGSNYIAARFGSDPACRTSPSCSDPSFHLQDIVDVACFSFLGCCKSNVGKW